MPSPSIEGMPKRLRFSVTSHVKPKAPWQSQVRLDVVKRGALPLVTMPMRFANLVFALVLVCGSAQAAPEPSFEPNSVQTVDFNSPQRAYLEVPGPLAIYAEASLAGDPTVHAAAVQKLAKTLEEVIEALPQHARGQMRSIKYYLMGGLRSPQGGLKGGMRYVAVGSRNPLWDSRWQGGIVVYSADNLMAMSAAQTQRALAHEMAHAWHLTRWSSREPGIYGPWEAAANRGLYKNIKDYKGRTVESAYAVKNQAEYFAELSAAYFVGLHYEPFDRKGLKTYDPAGYRMVEQFWAPL